MKIRRKNLKKLLSTDSTSESSAESSGEKAFLSAISRDVTPEFKRVGFKKNFSWALVGNIALQASKWLNLVVLAKLMGVAEVGRFALALAICTPISVLSSLNLRLVQVTDVREAHAFGHFFAVQLCLSTVSVAVIGSIAWLSGFETRTAWVVFLYGLSQMVVVLHEVFLAFYQKHERMDMVAVSKLLLSVASLTAMATLVWITGDLFFGVLGILLTNLGVLLLWDIGAAGRLVRATSRAGSIKFFRPIFELQAMSSLVRLALPLGIASVIHSLHMNVPRYFVAGFMGEEALGIFAPIVAVAMANKLAIHAATISALPRLSRYYLENQRAFIALLVKLAAAGGFLAFFGLLVVYLFGETLLTFFLTSEHVAHTNILQWSMVFAAVEYVVTFFAYGVTAMRQFWIQPIINILALFATLSIAAVFVPRYGFVAALWSLIAGSLVQGICSVGLIYVGIKRPDVLKPRAANQNQSTGN